jgi:Concanavalin A-like lectin/glucanases superfamily/Secretion system C-terminal sorting domain
MRTLTYLLLAVASPVLSQPAAGLVGFWPLNADYQDASGNGLHGVANNVGALPTDNRQGSEGCAYRMIEGGFYVPESSAFEVLPNGGLTMSYWTRQGQSDSFGRMMLQPAGPSLGIILETWYLGRPSFGQLGSQIEADSSQAVFDGAWHLITGVYDQGNWYLYFDANLLQQETSGNVLAYPGPAALSVGGAWNTDFDDVRVYDRALNAVEVGLLFEEQADCAIAAALEEEAIPAPSIGPNPTAGTVYIRFSEPLRAGSHIEVIDHTGRRLVERVINALTTTIDLSAFASGVYEVRILSGQAQRAIRIVRE